MEDEYVWLTHPDIPDSIVRQPTDVPIVEHLRARGWVETIDPQLAAEQQQAALATVEPPPKAGVGSGRDAWVEYAAEIGVDVTDDMTRDDIIDAVQALDPNNEES